MKKGKDFIILDTKNRIFSPNEVLEGSKFGKGKNFLWGVRNGLICELPPPPTESKPGATLKIRTEFNKISKNNEPLPNPRISKVRQN